MIAIFCGPFYAVCAGGHAAAVADAHGADFNDAAKIGVKAGVSAYITQGASQYSGGNWFTQAVVKGTAGGVASEIQGGEFKDGFKMGFATSVLYSGVEAFKNAYKDPAVITSDANLGVRPRGADYVVGIQPSSKAIANPNWFQEAGDYIAVTRTDGSGVMGFLENYAPGFHSGGALHDPWVNFALDMNWGNNLITNQLTIAPVFVVNYAAAGLGNINLQIKNQRINRASSGN